MTSQELPKVETLGHNHIKLPEWLDDLIYKDIKATHQPCGKDMIVLNWDRKEIKNYLGTYFPRSFAESYCIFSKYFDVKKRDYQEIKVLNIFDFGCGTGGELFGLLWAIKENLEVSTINIKALDGNFNGLRLLENIMERFSNNFHREIYLHLMPFQIDDVYDMSLVSTHIPANNDIIVIFKSICEMASLRQFDEKNPYEHILEIMIDKLNPKGIICLADVSSFNEGQQEWLPKLIDKACIKTNTTICMKNNDYNEMYSVSHTGKSRDTSKLSWRIITNSI